MTATERSFGGTFLTNPGAFRRSLGRLFSVFGFSLLALLPGGCELGSTISLGEGHQGLGGAAPAVELFATDVQVVKEVSSEDKDDNPTLSGDELELCLTSKRENGLGGADIWCTRRESVDLPFEEPQSVELANSDGFESSPALSLDALTLWFATRPDDGSEEPDLDIFAITRKDRREPWAEPSRIDELSTDFDDIPRPVAMNDSVMPLASRNENDVYQTYFASRTSSDSPFSAPLVLQELAFDRIQIVDAQLSEDGRLLIYTRVDLDADDPADIYFSYREQPDLPFGAPQPVEGANSDEDDRDPWLSLDGKRLYFSSNRSGDFEIYFASVTFQRNSTD